MTAHLTLQTQINTMYQLKISVAAESGAKMSSNVAWYTLNRKLP